MVTMGANDDGKPVTILIKFPLRSKASGTLCAIVKGFIDSNGHKETYKAKCDQGFTSNTYKYGKHGNVNDAAYSNA